jgi:hypothetical protein
VPQLGPGFDLVEARMHDGPQRRKSVKIGVSADRRHAENGGNLHDALHCFRRVTLSSGGGRQAVADRYDSAIGRTLEADATNSEAVGLTPDLVVAERALLAVLVRSAQKTADG